VRREQQIDVAATAHDRFVTVVGEVVELWTIGATRPTASFRPFSFDVTAICGCGEGVYVAGRDRDDAATARFEQQLREHPARKDVDYLPYLKPAEVVRLDQGSQAERQQFAGVERIEHLACGGWLLALTDDGHLIGRTRTGTDSLRALGAPGQVVLTSDGEQAVAVGESGLMRMDLSSGFLTQQGLPPSKRLLSINEILPLDTAVFAATDHGLTRLPDGAHWTRRWRAPHERATRDMHARSLARWHDSVMVLWEDGLLEEREPRTGRVIRAKRVPGR
jgi:hypothetical protein